MVSISIASLIYKSTRLADWVYESIVRYTPMIKTGEAEFYFVANDPSERLVEHLSRRGYKYFINNNPQRKVDEMFAMGYAYPEYIGRVYMGYNAAILYAKGEIVVLVNSDHYFSPDWLENLLKYYDSEKIVTSQLIEPKHWKFSVFPSAIEAEFGNTPDSFDEYGFIEFVNKNKVTGIYKGGAYMPCLFNKSKAFYSGLYPEGNLADKTFNQIRMTGDVAFFNKMELSGVMHITSRDSIVYHLKEGEKDEEKQGNVVNRGEMETINSRLVDFNYNNIFRVMFNDYRMNISPLKIHNEIIDKFLAKDKNKTSIGKNKTVLKLKDRIKKIKVLMFLWKIWCFLRKYKR
jgi:hypothetical protein